MQHACIRATNTSSTTDQFHQVAELDGVERSYGLGRRRPGVVDAPVGGRLVARARRPRRRRRHRRPRAFTNGQAAEEADNTHNKGTM